MKTKMCVVCLMAVLLGASAFAVGFVGTPTAELGQGKWGLGYNYSYSVQDLDKTDIKWSEFDGGVLEDSDVDKLEIKDMKIHRHYATLSYGIADCWDIYANLGVADTKFDTKWDGGWEQGYNFDNDFAWGWGTKYTFAKDEKIAWGANLQMNFLDTEWSEDGVDVDGYWTDEVTIETWDLLIAVGPTVDMGGWKLYGGPFYYYLDGDWTGEYTWEDGDDSAKEDGDLEADSNFGGYIGAEFPLAENWITNVEFNLTGDGWGAGVGVTLKF